MFSLKFLSSAGGRWPKSHTSFPSFVNFRMLSCAPVPATQTKPFESTITVCSAVGHFSDGFVAPRVNDVPFLVELDQLRTLDAAVEASVGAAGFVGVRGRRAVEEPDVIVARIDADARDLLHAPLVRQPLGPERIDLVDGRAALV